MIRKLLLVSLMALFAVPALAVAQVIRWAGNVDVGRYAILHAPDNRWTALDPPVTVSDFGPPMVYTGLAALLGVSEADLARADVIAFELNGGSPPNGPGGGWESSTWTFTDGTSSHTVKFSQLDPPSSYGPPSYPAVVANGSIVGRDGSYQTGGEAYSRFFGMCCAADKVISYILFDLDTHLSPAIDVRSPSFSVRIQSRPAPPEEEGTPEPDAVGVFSSCPKPCP